MIDCLVVGAGPSGLFMAAELARYGLLCRIIDKAFSISDKSRAIVIQPRTLEIFDHLGIADEFLSKGLKISRFTPYSQNKPIGTIDLSILDSPFPFALSLEQSKTESILTEYLQNFGVFVERGIELSSFTQDCQKTTAFLTNNQTGSTEILNASYLIASDGAHSTIRKQLQLPFEGKEIPSIFSLADVHIRWDYPAQSAKAFLNHSGILAVIPLAEKNKYRLIFQLPKIKEPTLEIIQELIHEYADPKAQIYDPIWMANFHIHSRMISRYKSGRVFLVGDAAHIHSPVGGQGMNTGLQDAFNLGWKLAYVKSKKATEPLLETYHLERSEIGKKLLKATELATKLILLRTPILVYLRNFLLSCALKLPPIHRKLAYAISQLSIFYPPNKVRVPSHFIRKGELHLLLIDLNDENGGIEKKLQKSFPKLFISRITKGDGNLFKNKNIYLIRPDGYIEFSEKFARAESLSLLFGANHLNF